MNMGITKNLKKLWIYFYQQLTTLQLDSHVIPRG